MSVVIRPLDAEGSRRILEASLPPLPESVAATAFVCVGDVIDTGGQAGFLRGHGTQVVEDRLVATLCGIVERVNKLIYVRPLRSRYTAEVGDVVVGRITEIAGKRWKVDLNSRQEAGLQLSAVNLPGGVQAEVQALHGDGSIALHTRSAKYGKLVGGQLVTVAPNLVKRQKQHFHPLKDVGVDLILGLNGMLWVSARGAPKAAEQAASSSMAKDAVLEDEDLEAEEDVATYPSLSQQDRIQCCRVANSIKALAHLCLSVHPNVVADTYLQSTRHNIQLQDMLEAPFLSIIAEAEAVRRQSDAAN